MKRAIGPLLIIVILAALLVFAVAACETPSETREDKQQHELNVEYERTHRETELARIRADEAQARAEEAIAHADAQIALAREQNRHSEDMYVLYMSSLAAYLDKSPKTNIWIAILAGALAAALLIPVLNRYLNRYLQ